MALIMCPECGNKISDKAASCPNCGSPVVRKCFYEVTNTSSIYRMIPTPSMSVCVKSYFTNWVSFKGRSRRSEYWYAILFQWIVMLIILLPISILAESGNPGDNTIMWIILICIIIPWFLFSSIATAALSIQRLHDVGMSGWLYVIILLVPFLGIVVGCMDSQQDSNKWGESPIYERVIYN